MTLVSLELENFRNFAALSLPLDARGGVVEAPNGHGKTNLLEALHYLNLFRSFRGASDAELVSFGQRGFRVRGEVEEREGSRRGLGVALEGARKRLSVDGREARPAEHIGVALSVILAPSDIRLVQGSPPRRRRYLDVILALSSRQYLKALQGYRRALGQRNRLLQSPGSSGAGQLEPWTEQLVHHGSSILRQRHRFLERWGSRFSEVYARLAGSPWGRLEWRYDSSVRVESAGLGEDGNDRGDGSDGLPHAAFADAFRAELERQSHRELRRGATLAGPHRDDLSFREQTSEGAERDLRTFGSQGEQRTAALALRFVESEVLASERGQLPAVLLDDAFSELDPERSRRVLSFLAPGQQVFLTTPKPLSFELPLDLPRYRVVGGVVRRER